jgi:hypothetical protein
MVWETPKSACRLEAVMTGAQLRDLLLSDEYRQGVEELSDYLASIAPETPMVHCLAKQLWKRQYKFQLEAKKKDLVVEGTHIEFKSNYDFGMEWLDRDLTKYGDRPLKAMRAAARLMNKSIGWDIGLRLYQDICEKNPALFVWIICSRDLSKASPEDRSRICMSKEQWDWNSRGHPYPDPTYLPIADSFLKRLQAEIIAEGDHSRVFSVLEAEIVTNGAIPSTYHFRICDFTPK